MTERTTHRVSDCKECSKINWRKIKESLILSAREAFYEYEMIDSKELYHTISFLDSATEDEIAMIMAITRAFSSPTQRPSSSSVLNLILDSLTNAKIVVQD